MGNKLAPQYVKRYRWGVAQTENVINEFNINYNMNNP